MAATTASSLQTFDIIILGATGFTGKHVLKQALKFFNNNNNNLNFNSIAIAGRNQSKLTQTLNWATRPTTFNSDSHRRHNRPNFTPFIMSQNTSHTQLCRSLSPSRRACRGSVCRNGL
ncbi:putative mitochondrial saccharopine dehydrogenase oxidoreductase [Trifolium repens]|nr:putative mitochondrial saccharopine dehydrogenase oxidoreductase [Trifolium repens]